MIKLVITSILLNMILTFSIICQNESYVNITGYYYPDSISHLTSTNLHFLELYEGQDDSGINHLQGNLLCYPKPDSEQRYKLNEAILDSSALRFTTIITKSEHYEFIGRFITTDSLCNKQFTEIILEGTLTKYHDGKLNKTSSVHFYYCQRAFERIRYLLPTAIPELPQKIASWITEKSFRIPQAQHELPCNYTQGEFYKKGQYDWAVLCSKDSISSIIVFGQGRTDHPSIIASSMDKNYLEQAPYAPLRYKWYNYFREIGTADSTKVKESIEYDNDTHAEGFQSFQRSHQADHDGIYDFGDKSVTIFYYQYGKWLQIHGEYE